MTLAPPGDGAPARLAVERAGEHPRDLLARVGIVAANPSPVIIVCGGADELRGPQLEAARAVLGPAVRAAVAATGAVIVDGGTAAGVMALVGDERDRDPASMPVLIGVAPAGKVEHADHDGSGTQLEPNHTHFVLADSDRWGGETPLLAAVAAELGHGEPIVMVLAGGGDGAVAELREAVARRWPVFAIEGTGGTAGAVAAAVRGRSREPDLVSMLQDGDVRPVGSRDPAELTNLLVAELRDGAGPRDAIVLEDAWRIFATYDRWAVRLRKAFEQFQVSILGLGIVATGFALIHDDVLHDGPARDVMHWLVIVAPITVSVLIALANRRGAGKRWVLLRAAAEATKSEIYRYRTRTGVYSREALRVCRPPADRPQKLAVRLTEIETELTQSAASSGPLTRYGGPLKDVMYDEDGLARLDAAGYMACRVEDQIGWYRDKVAALDRRRSRLQLVTLVAGGAGTLLAALGFDVWIGLTTALAGAALAHLGYLQVDNTIVAYNRASGQLSALRLEFRASGAREPDLETLVTRAETILTTELGGWVQQMTDALAELQAQQSEAAEKVAQERDERAAAR